MTVYTTSGTTGKPKHFNLTDAQMAARVATINDTTRGAGFSALKSIFVDFHPTSIIGARYQAYGQKSGVKIVFPSLGTTEATLAMLIKDGIDGIASTPSGLLNYATASKGSYQPRWMMASTAGLSAATSRSIRAGLGDNLWASYACSEIGTIAVASAEQIETITGCVGKVVPGVVLQFINKEIVAKSDAMIAGYDDPGLTAAHFKDGWYHTGDLGHMFTTAAGELLLVYDGRKPA